MSVESLLDRDDEASAFLVWSTGMPERNFVRIVTCLLPEFDFVAYARDHLDEIKSELYAYGAVLVRGLAPRAERFAALCDLFGPPAKHSELSSLRTQLGPGIYTSTDHPADQKIVMHNEQAYLSYWPKVIGFMCVTPASRGGQTPIADCRNFDAEIPAELAQRLRNFGVKYVRNIGAESTIPWKTVFAVESKEELEAYCARRGIAVSWQPDGTPRTVSPLPAYQRHPVTGTDCFFNNIVSSSHYSLAAKQQYQVEQLFKTVLDHPNTVLLGDGTPLTREEIEALLAAYDRRTFQFDWKEGDILIADNLMTAHARNAFAGARKVIVRINDIHDSLQHPGDRAPEAA
ncbi:MAG: TauD/TfdA family dioxygenase [Hyphomicrobiales bacterium]|nr:TauD/TfdA family dioxygenase [Hyphomicrobiales bacterium]MBV8824260.1 TauD/TfdA family dioxygenase [Hyphomicrobiales bacterium]MBV9428584.1 TauD/TfdA family dioxygenase [Bradyrhizobiaceae bacterium]